MSTCPECNSRIIKSILRKTQTHYQTTDICLNDHVYFTTKNIMTLEVKIIKIEDE